MRTTAEQIDAHLQAAAALRQAEPVLDRIVDLIVGAFRGGRRLYLIGNGGSAADAQHIAAELVGRFNHSNRRPLPAVALTTDTSALTAIGNDFGYEEVFRRPVEALVQPGDVLWALSVSGSSPNVIKAVRQARRQDASIVGFTGLGGAILRDLSDVCLVAEHRDSDRVQEVHQLAYHMVCGRIEQAFVE